VVTYEDDLELEIGEPVTHPARFVWTILIDGAWRNGVPGLFVLDETNRQLMLHINHESTMASHELAVERIVSRMGPLKIRFTAVLSGLVRPSHRPRPVELGDRVSGAKPQHDDDSSLWNDEHHRKHIGWTRTAVRRRVLQDVGGDIRGAERFVEFDDYFL
jgi:hypothetical protein